MKNKDAIFILFLHNLLASRPECRNINLHLHNNKISVVI